MPLVKAISTAGVRGCGIARGVVVGRDLPGRRRAQAKSRLPALQPDRRDGAGAEGDSRRAAAARTARAKPDWEDRLNQVMQSRGRQPNLSFFAFTATPKGKTLELFGRPGASGMPEAFHIYTMRQAIEEGFILDVLKNYTTYSHLLPAAEGRRGRSASCRRRRRRGRWPSS